MDLSSDNVKRVISALARSENAQTLMQFVEETKLSVDEVSAVLDFLVMIRVFASDNSFVQSEIGDMVYMFADNDTAQMVARSFEQEQ